MADSSHGRQLTRSNPVRPKYKIISYIVAWLAALFATNPDGGLWALAWMFLLGLAAFINPHWATVAVGDCLGLASEFTLFMPTFTSARETCARRFFCSASLPSCSSAMFQGAGR
jgi:hypothetical protein